MDKLGEHRQRFKFVRPNGSATYFNVGSLARYMLATGDFSEPETRLPFRDDDLRRIDRAASRAGLGLASVFDAKRHGAARFKDLAFRRDALLGLERCAGEVISEMLALVDEQAARVRRAQARERGEGSDGEGGHGGGGGWDDDDGPNPEQAQLALVLQLFPQLSNFLGQMRQADAKYAASCVQQYLSFVRGPPNRPTSNVFGLRDSILAYLKGQANGGGHQYGY